MRAAAPTTAWGAAQQRIPPDQRARVHSPAGRWMRAFGAQVQGQRW